MALDILQPASYSQLIGMPGTPGKKNPYTCPAQYLTHGHAAMSVGEVLWV